MIHYFLITVLDTREEKIWNESCLALALKELTVGKTDSRRIIQRE